MDANAIHRRNPSQESEESRYPLAVEAKFKNQSESCRETLKYGGIDKVFESIFSFELSMNLD